MQRNSSKRDSRVIAALVVLIIVLVAVAVCLFLTSKSPQPISHHNKTTVPTSTSSSNLTAGGVEVPQQFVDKAKSLGYYCPSWAAQSGGAASGLCLPLDK